MKRFFSWLRRPHPLAEALKRADTIYIGTGGKPIVFRREETPDDRA